MRVVLRHDVTGLGLRGDVVDVTGGYARNYLVPRELAFVATDGVAKQAGAMRRARDLREARSREAAETIATTLVAKTLSIAVRAGSGGRLFGSVTAADIVDALKAQAGVEIDRRRVHLDEPIKSLGMREVPVRLHTDVEITLNIEVVSA